MTFLHLVSKYPLEPLLMTAIQSVCLYYGMHAVLLVEST